MNGCAKPKQDALFPLPKGTRFSLRTGEPICRCGRGYGSRVDGLCLFCRGCTAWESVHGQSSHSRKANPKVAARREFLHEQVFARMSEMRFRLASTLRVKYGWSADRAVGFAFAHDPYVV